jgi:predicted nucleic acid-binding protein
VILVDTDVLIEIFDRGSKKGDAAIKKIKDTGEDVMITSINLHEILYGLYKFGKRTGTDKVMLLDVTGFRKEDAVRSARLEIEMEKKGRKLARTDAMIAAMALNRKTRLFTYNKKHFQGIKGLELL